MIFETNASVPTSASVPVTLRSRNEHGVQKELFNVTGSDKSLFGIFMRSQRKLRMFLQPWYRLRLLVGLPYSHRPGRAQKGVRNFSTFREVSDVQLKTTLMNLNVLQTGIAQRYL